MAQMANSECQWLGEAMETASRFLSSRALRRSATHLGVAGVRRLTNLLRDSYKPAVGIDQIDDVDVAFHVADTREDAPARGH